MYLNSGITYSLTVALGSWFRSFSWFQVFIILNVLNKIVRETYSNEDMHCGPGQGRTASNDLDFQSSALPVELPAHLWVLPHCS